MHLSRRQSLCTLLGLGMLCCVPVEAIVPSNATLDASSSEREFPPSRVRIPDRDRRERDAPAAFHLPGHALQASDRVTLIAELQRDTRAIDADTTQSVFVPQAFLLFGGNLYAGIGIGTVYSDRRLGTSPIIGFRTGLSLDLHPRVQFDLSVHVQLRDSSRDPRADAEDAGADALNIGAAIRFSF